ncbi:MBL fold metallo-hydrolase [Desulfosporosinus orientis]|nr:MBL fold metallo-hydrolase [Desulfosporosinus orientis]
MLQIKEPKNEVNIACVPVGGFYTIDAEQAYKVVQQINPKIVLF